MTTSPRFTTDDFELESMAHRASLSQDGASEPLISHSLDRPETPGSTIEDETQEIDEADESKLVRPGLFIWVLTLCAGISGLLFGYDTGVISSTLVSINTDLNSRLLTTWDKSLITSCTSLFALFASPLTGVLADSIGRKRVILAADALFIVGALWQALTSSVWGMVGGRSVVGIAVGSASFVVPLYIGEVSPSPFRGRLVTVSSLFITGGQVVAYIIGWLFSERAGGWRWMVGLGALPAALQLGLLVLMPETPRWLVKAGLKERARRVLKKVYGEGDVMDGVVEGVLKRVEREIMEEEIQGGGVEREVEGSRDASKAGWKKNLDRVGDGFSLLVDIGANRRALIIACMLQGFQQLCGFNSLMYFSATIFSLVGFRSPTLTSLSIAITNFIFTLVAFHYIDRIGRRRILLYSIPIMVLGLVLCSIAFNFITLPGSRASEVQAAAPNQNLAWPLIILLSMILYVSGYAIGLGNVPWQQGELFPLSVRSLGSGIATATNWGSNFIIGISFLPMMELITPVGTFAAYAGVCLLSWWTIWKIYPETAGLSLEGVNGLLKDGWGVQESIRRREH